MDQLFLVYVWELLLHAYVEFAGRLVLKVLFEHFSSWTLLRADFETHQIFS